MNQKKPVDSHCHLDFEQFDNDRKQVIKRLKARTAFVVNAGINPEHNQKTLKLAAEHDEINPALGIHPVYTDSFDQIDQVKQQIKENNPVAVGEIGLDHHHITDAGKRKKQEKVFTEMVDFAEEHSLPVVVHSREAERKAYKILKDRKTDVFLHCFNGKPELAKKAAENGIKIGVTTQVLYSSRVQNIARKISLEDILLETDSPYLYRGERNEPVNVQESAEKIAELKDTSVEEVVKKTTRNAKNFYST